MTTVSFIFVFILIWFLINIINNDNSLSKYSSILPIISSGFSNVVIAYSNYNITLYRGDKSGENFLFAVKNNPISFSLNDINIIYEKAEKLHIHNKIIITDFPISTSSTISEKLQEYGIEVWNRNKLKSIALSTSTSALKTSDTSDDTCDIDENLEDPIQDGTFNTHGIFSIFNDKTEHL